MSKKTKSARKVVLESVLRAGAPGRINELGTYEESCKVGHLSSDCGRRVGLHTRRMIYLRHSQVEYQSQACLL